MSETRNAYYLDVEGLLVKVAKNEKEVIYNKVDETPLLAALEKQIPLAEKREYNWVDTPEGFFEGLVKGDVEMLVNFINEHGICACVSLRVRRSEYLRLDAVNFCAIGGFAKSLDRLWNQIGIRHITNIYDCDNTVALGAISGNTDILKIRGVGYGYNLSKIKKYAKRYNHPEYYHAAKWSYAEVCRVNPPWNYKEPEPKEIPSLLTIASHVVASELLSLSPSFSSPSNSQTFSNISLLPTKLLDMVCGKIAKSDQGSVVFDFLEKSTGRKVSLSSRIDAAHSLEQKTRNFTNNVFVVDQDKAQPLIDVFAEYDSFVIQPHDELEETSARFFASPRVVDTPSIVTKSQFEKQFKAITGGFFEGFDFSKTVVIGGSVVGALLPINPNPIVEESNSDNDDNESDNNDDNYNDANDENDDNDDNDENKEGEDGGKVDMGTWDQEQDEALDAELKAERENRQEGEEGEEREDGEGRKDREEGEEGEDRWYGGRGGYTNGPRQPRPKKQKEKEKEKEEKKPLNTPLTLQEYFLKASPFKGSDINIYLYDMDNKQFADKVEYIFNHLQKFLGEERKIFVAYGTGCIAFIPHYPFRSIQIVIRKFTSIWQILTGVDIDSSAYAYDGEKVWTTVRGRYGMNYRWSLPHPQLYLIRGYLNYETRLIKYSKRGFTIVDREYPKHGYDISDCKNMDSYDIDFAPDYRPDYYGAKLVAAADQFKRVRKIIESKAKKLGGIPFGPKIGEKEVIKHLAVVADVSDVGYGPSDTSLSETSLHKALAKIRNEELLSEQPFKVYPWS